jgi:carboxyl-terminal processing protease
MSGLFIEKGPIVQVKNRRDEAEIIEDKDPSVAYNGPLVVMVNTGSASASEILTAALQDYNRALIVGSKSTFGKGTVQRPYDLDRSVRGNEEIKPLGAIKLTTQKFYRINGGSVQLKGVTPDIILPDSYHYIETGEREDEFAMNWSEIDPVDFNQSVFTLENKNLVVEKSKERIANHPVFQDILANATWIKNQEEATVFPLDLKDLIEYEKERRGKVDAFKKSFDTVFIEGIYNLPTDLAIIESDESKKARNEEWIKAIKGDIYLAESLNILKDLVATQN